AGGLGTKRRQKRKGESRAAGVRLSAFRASGSLKRHDPPACRGAGAPRVPYVGPAAAGAAASRADRPRLARELPGSALVAARAQGRLLGLRRARASGGA